MPNNEPLLITEAGVAYLATQLKAYTDAKVAEAQQTAVMRSGSKWKDLVDAINVMLGTSFGYDADLDDITDALSAYEPNTLPTGIELWDGSTAASIVDILQYPENVKSISLPGVIKFNGIVTFKNIESISFPHLTDLPASAFESCILLENVYLPSLMQTVTNGNTQRVFWGCTSLRRIELPNLRGTGYMGYTFTYCNNLEVVKIPMFPSTFYVDVFASCPSLKYVYAPKATDISYYTAFAGCSDLRSLTMYSESTFNANIMSASSKLYRWCLTNPITTSKNYSFWNPTLAIDSGLSDLINQEEWDLERDETTPVDCTGFSNNQEKFLYFFKNVFMPSFATVLTTQTLSLKSTIYDVITTDTDITSYFSSHGWTLARVA